ncbi:SDR family NAD(P)-dependent oxidoreductase [Pararhodobacter sp.]|uniref:SDR family NAD(P)-dependent oxidoreductase n=1 Tax=Pararhodobacter sp. TaxID=2127056 RepID=UPI002FDD115C
MDLGLTGRIAIITGGARGIGLAHARALGAEGARVAITDIDGPACNTAAATLRNAGVHAIALPGDATDEQTVADTIASVLETEGRIDILINNAGIGVKPAYPVAEMPAEAWDRMIHVHMRSAFLWSRGVIAPMRVNGFGRIVSMSSMNFTGGGRVGVAHYAAAKAGIVGMTQTLAKEVGRDGITVNAVAPGYVATELIAGFDAATRALLCAQNPIGRLCAPEEVAAAVTFLCSAQAAFINGECICIDGGRRDFYWS